jgi:hypothetical protein
LRSPALISTSSKAGCHAVLASLSERYPPLEGRSPTRYSPVCHSTYPLRDFRVRLACVRHAASVDSEPGSNSHVKFAGSLLGVRLAPNSDDEHNSLTRGRFGFCVVQSAVNKWFIASRLRTDCQLRSTDSTMPLADTLSPALPTRSRSCRHARVLIFQTGDGLCVLARSI